MTIKTKRSVSALAKVKTLPQFDLTKAFLPNKRKLTKREKKALRRPISDFVRV